MKISIVTISYNQRKFLRDCMDSIVEQGDDGLDYIIVDAGSTDGSRELIREYENRVSNVVFEPDRGPADGLNKGFKLAKGDIFGYVNADDVLLPGALAKVRETMMSDKDMDVLQGHGVVVDGSGSWRRNMYSNCFSAYGFAMGVCRVVQQSTFFRAQAFHRTEGFNWENRTCWDAELLVDMALSGARFQVVDAMLAEFRLHDQSITGSARLHAECLADLRRIQEKILGRKPNAMDFALRWLLRSTDWVIHPHVTLHSAACRLGSVLGFQLPDPFRYPGEHDRRS